MYGEELDQQYGQLCKDLTTRLGIDIEVISTGGGFYALAATLESGHLMLVTNGNGIDGLGCRSQMEGWAVTIQDGGDERVRLLAPDPKGLLILIDEEDDAQELGDLIQRAIRTLTFKPGTPVRHRRWPQAAAGTIAEFPAVDPDGQGHTDLAEVHWPEGIEIEDIADLV